MLADAYSLLECMAVNVEKRFDFILRKIADPSVRRTRQLIGVGLRRGSVLLEQLGISPSKIKRRHYGKVRYKNNFNEFTKLLGDSKEWPIGNHYPILDEWYGDSGAASGHYFHQDIWAARKIFRRNPVRHIDVGSRIDGFVAHVACFREIEVYDIRPNSSQVKNIKFVQRDLMKSAEGDICDSLSCLHVIEHFGLGRYGDEIDPWGYKRGFKYMFDLLRPDGAFYLSVPIGPQRVEFNAHRVFGLKHLLNMIDGLGLDIIEFSLVDDAGSLIENVPLTEEAIMSNCFVNLGCGLFDLRKRG